MSSQVLSTYITLAFWLEDTMRLCFQLFGETDLRSFSLWDF